MGNNTQLEEIIKTIKELMNENVVVVNIIKKAGRGFNNYKTSMIGIYVPPYIKKYGEDDILHVKVIEIRCGEYNNIQYCIDVINSLEDLKFLIIEREPACFFP